MLSKRFLYFLFCFIAIIRSSLWGQELLVPSLVMPKNSTMQLKNALKVTSEVLNLPFLDDFSYRSFVPDSRLWEDRKVYINTHYAIKPISIGVATFDMLDENGMLYEQMGNASYFGADTLTSRPINLSSYRLADSLYLSFFYQAGGYGDFPEAGDSLKVEFFSELSGQWIKVWSVPGLKNDTVAPSFKIALIPINRSSWLDSTFRFRFINIASAFFSGTSTKGMRANGDIWNIDYVYLNKNRSYTDTAFNDITIVEPIGSFLKNYRSIPWRHYQNKFFQAVRDKINLIVYNLSNFSTSVEDKIVIRDVYQQTTDEPIITAIDITGRSYTSFEEDCPILKSDHSDSALFQITAAITTNRYDRKSNDTVISYQFFKNFYAYDDGTAEFGYGLKGNNTAGGWVACRFTSYLQDTLVAVDLFFNRTFNDENLAYFNLWVWDDNNGLPGDSIGGKKECRVQSGSFVRYYLQQPVTLPFTFYVGWQQVDETFLNVGYDRNSPNNQNIFYNIDGSWTPSTLRQRGALMIRPVFGRKSEVGLKYSQFPFAFSCYPNPAKDWTRVYFSDPKADLQAKLFLYDLSGRLMFHESVFSGDRVSLQQLPEGVYLMQIRLSDSRIYHVKLIKTR